MDNPVFERCWLGIHKHTAGSLQAAGIFCILKFQEAALRQNTTPRGCLRATLRAIAYATSGTCPSWKAHFLDFQPWRLSAGLQCPSPAWLSVPATARSKFRQRNATQNSSGFCLIKLSLVLVLGWGVYGYAQEKAQLSSRRPWSQSFELKSLASPKPRPLCWRLETPYSPMSLNPRKWLQVPVASGLKARIMCHPRKRPQHRIPVSDVQNRASAMAFSPRDLPKQRAHGHPPVEEVAAMTKQDTDPSEFMGSPTTPLYTTQLRSPLN